MKPLLNLIITESNALFDKAGDQVSCWNICNLASTFVRNCWVSRRTLYGVLARFLHVCTGFHESYKCCNTFKTWSFPTGRKSNNSAYKNYTILPSQNRGGARGGFEGSDDPPSAGTIKITCKPNKLQAHLLTNLLTSQTDSSPDCVLSWPNITLSLRQTTVQTVYCHGLTSPSVSGRQQSRLCTSMA